MAPPWVGKGTKAAVGADHPNRIGDMMSNEVEAVEAAENEGLVIPEESGVSQDMLESAKKDLAQKNAARESGVKVFRRGERQSELRVLDIYPFPADFDVEGIAPTSYLAQPVGDITGFIDTQEFTVIEERLKGLVFDKPARDLEKGATLKTVKALKPMGGLVQLPWEAQINNGAGGDVSDMVGVRRYQKKGYHLFLDPVTGLPMYCYTLNCWAAAMVPQLVGDYPQHSQAIGTGFCSLKHFTFSSPNEAKKFLTGYTGMFSDGATTTASRG